MQRKRSAKDAFVDKSFDTKLAMLTTAVGDSLQDLVSHFLSVSHWKHARRVFVIQKTTDMRTHQVYTYVSVYDVTRF